MLSNKTFILVQPKMSHLEQLVDYHLFSAVYVEHIAYCNLKRKLDWVFKLTVCVPMQCNEINLFNKYVWLQLTPIINKHIFFLNLIRTVLHFHLHLFSPSFIHKQFNQKHLIIKLVLLRETENIGGEWGDVKPLTLESHWNRKS